MRRAEHRGHVWSYDFVLDRTEQGGLLKSLVVPDEHTWEAHAIEVWRSSTGKDVVAVLQRLIRVHGESEYPRSDNGTEFMAEVVWKGLEDAGVSPRYWLSSSGSNTTKSGLTCRWAI
ncbi:MAG: transposase [Gemmatimonadales bacterium]|nr:MAG: transposase [Gemmatimonadales bacterium]